MHLKKKKRLFLPTLIFVFNTAGRFRRLLLCLGFEQSTDYPTGSVNSCKRHDWFWCCTLGECVWGGGGSLQVGLYSEGEQLTLSALSLFKSEHGPVSSPSRKQSNATQWRHCICQADGSPRVNKRQGLNFHSAWPSFSLFIYLFFGLNPFATIPSLLP